MPSGGKVTVLGEVSTSAAGTITDPALSLTANSLVDQQIYFSESGEVYTIISNTTNSISFSSSKVIEPGTPFAVKETIVNTQPVTPTQNNATGILYTFLPLYIDPAPALPVNVALVHQ